MAVTKESARQQYGEIRVVTCYCSYVALTPALLREWLHAAQTILYCYLLDLICYYSIIIMLIKTALHIIICFCFQQDPWLHHYASGSAGPSLSPEIARSARPLPVRIDNSMYNIESLSLLLHVAVIVP